jgi:hypothetical protein
VSKYERGRQRLDLVKVVETEAELGGDSHEFATEIKNVLATGRHPGES